ncbi:unnamed protein product [Rotaria magnacalcarata]
MKIFPSVLLLILSTLYETVDGSHFRGGIISWRPLNNTPSGSHASILIHQRYFWNRQWVGFSTPYCDESIVTSQAAIPVGSTMTCLQNCSSSTYTPLSTVMTSTDCDANTLIQSWAGERYDTLSLPLTTSITIGFPSNAWFTSLYIGGGLSWSIVNRLNLAVRPDGYINTSPVTNTLPVVFVPVNTQTVHVVQMADNDDTDILKCRWSNAATSTNYNRYDECGGVCSGLPVSTVLYSSNCTLVFTLPVTSIYYACALQIEDYYDSSSVSPMSSVPIQFLFYAYTASGSACSSRPAVIGDRPNRACIGVPINVQLNETIIVQTYCTGQTIVDFVTSSPIGMVHSAISNPSSGLWRMTLTWTPISAQSGPQGFCAAAIDNRNLQSDPWCLTYLVDYTSPNIIRPTIVQGSASPIGTVFSNQSIFSIMATNPVGRPSRNGTNVCFNDAATNTSVVCYDAGYASNLLYNGYTITIITNVVWTYGHTYYVTMDSGFASGNVFCHAESAPITDTTFWTFNIWDPSVSSTTTTTTTPPTTHTVTTRTISFTTVNTLLTTTGIVITTTNMSGSTTTSATTTTSTTTSTSTATTVTTTQLVTDMMIITPQDFEAACTQPVAIVTTLISIAMVPVHIVGLFTLLTKVNKTFNPDFIRAQLRHDKRMWRAGRG